jgi:hypothetical protein
MLQWLYMYVANFGFQCFIYFSRRMLQACYFDNAYVSHICCKCFLCCVCFTMVFKCFLSVSDASFKCFIYLQTYVASVASGCFKSRSGVASPSSHSIASPPCLLLLPTLARHPPPPLPLLDVVDTRGGVGLVWARETAWETDCTLLHKIFSEMNIFY